jgi:hypothetical protein
MASCASAIVKLPAPLAARGGLQGIGKIHFSPRNRCLHSGALSPLPVEIAKPHFGDADSAGFERLPNQLAAHANSRIIVPD